MFLHFILIECLPLFIIIFIRVDVRWRPVPRWAPLRHGKFDLHHRAILLIKSEKKVNRCIRMINSATLPAARAFRNWAARSGLGGARSGRSLCLPPLPDSACAERSNQAPSASPCRQIRADNARSPWTCRHCQRPGDRSRWSTHPSAARPTTPPCGS